MPVFDGGYMEPQTFIEASKQLIDRLHAFYTADPSRLKPDDFTRSADSLHFYHSMVVIEKKPQTVPRDMTYGSVREFRYVAPSLSGR
jgi:hypothetical protein